MKKLILISALLFSFNTWAECIEGNCVNGQGTYTYPSGSQYIGEWKDGNRHGEGTYTYANGTKEGFWITDKFKGTITEEGLRERCVSYGFTGDNNIAACVQREAQHHLELAKREAQHQLELANLANQENESRYRRKVAQHQSSNQSSQTQRQSNAQQQADAKRQREAQALINLGALISGIGTTNKTNRTTPRINTYPDNFSTTLTVPSNQNCPLKGTPLTKQEVRGSNRICYYQ
jgi:hypothetical protein